MNTVTLIIEILLIAAGVFLIAAVLMQQGKSHGLSGAIAGGAETFFGKEKGKRWDKRLARLTTVIGIAFVAIVLLLFILVPDVKQSYVYSGDNFANSPYYAIETTPFVDTTTNS